MHGSELAEDLMGEPTMAGRIDRRNFLKGLGIGGVVFALGGCWPRYGSAPNGADHDRKTPFSRNIKAALATWPADFSLGYSASRGMRRDDYAAMWVDGTGAGEIDVTRANFDMAQPVGRFAGKVDGELVKSLARALAKVDFEHPYRLMQSGEVSTMLEICANGHLATLALKNLDPDSRTYGTISEALVRLGGELSNKPAAAASLALSRVGTGFKLVFSRHGAAPMLVGNPALAGKTEPFFFLLQCGRPDPAFVKWDSFVVPAPDAQFEGGARYLFCEPPGWTFEFDDPSAGAAAKAKYIRAIFGDYRRPPAMRMGGVDVFARVVVSNVIEVPTP